jgi:hypothetical protein
MLSLRQVSTIDTIAATRGRLSNCTVYGIAEVAVNTVRPRETNGRNFLPKRDLTGYCNTTGDYSCNGITACRAYPGRFRTIWWERGITVS